VRRHSVSAGAIVIRPDGRFLAVCRRDTGAWVTPGGIVEHAEPLREAAAREVYEETGIKAVIGDLIGAYQNLATDVVSFVFAATPEGDGHATQGTAEADHVRWLTPVEADNLMTESFTIRIHDAYDGVRGAIRAITQPHIMEPKHT
jgi:8-oxo-dGTP pyrophosphatase MutT (NUDIX family)